MSLLISKSIAQLLLPPGGLILLGLIGLIFWKRWWGRGFVLLSLTALWLLSTEPVRDALTSPLEFRYSVLDVHKVPANGAAIVLLGGGVYENAPEYGGRDELGRYALMRTVYAADIARQNGLDIYASGASPLAEDAEPEGEVMRRWLLKLGLPESAAFAETAANTTWENASYMKTLLSGKGIDTVVLVTSAWHMPRSVWCFESQGLKVIPAPTDFMTKQKAYDLRSYLPHWTTLAASGQAMHEYIGLFWYRLKYGE